MVQLQLSPRINYPLGYQRYRLARVPRMANRPWQEQGMIGFLSRYQMVEWVYVRQIQCPSGRVPAGITCDISILMMITRLGTWQQKNIGCQLIYILVVWNTQFFTYFMPDFGIKFFTI